VAVTRHLGISRPGPTARVRVVEHTDAGVRRREDRLAGEEPLEVRLGWPGAPAQRVLVTMRTPGHDFELAVGVLFAEQLLTNGMLHSVRYCDDAPTDPRHVFNVVTVTMGSAPLRPLVARQASVTAASSACGVCGADSIEDVLRPTVGRDARPPADFRLSAEVVRRLPDRLREHQRHFSRTGGLHAAGLFDPTGEPAVVREDVGRHNAVDKVVGHRLLEGADPGLPVLAVSGRLGYEIVQKAVVAGITVVVAVGAPSSLAVELAEAAGTTLVGFAGPTRFVVYSHPERVGV
jgi:FdhD protein